MKKNKQLNEGHAYSSRFMKEIIRNNDFFKYYTPDDFFYSPFKMHRQEHISAGSNIYAKVFKTLSDLNVCYCNVLKKDFVDDIYESAVKRPDEEYKEHYEQINVAVGNGNFNTDLLKYNDKLYGYVHKINKTFGYLVKYLDMYFTGNFEVTLGGQIGNIPMILS